MTKLELLQNIRSSKIGKRLDDLRRQCNAGRLHGLVVFAFDGWKTDMLTAGDVGDESMSTWFGLLGEAFSDRDDDKDEDIIDIDDEELIETVA